MFNFGRKNAGPLSWCKLAVIVLSIDLRQWPVATPSNLKINLQGLESRTIDAVELVIIFMEVFQLLLLSVPHHQALMHAFGFPPTLLFIVVVQT